MVGWMDARVDRARARGWGIVAWMDRWERIRVDAWSGAMGARGVARATRATEMVTTRSIAGRYASVSWAWIDLGG